MVLHGDLCGVLHLIQILVVQLCQCRRGHGAGGADLRLTAALRPGDGGVGLGQVADDAGGGKPPANLLVGKAFRHLSVFEDGGQHAAGAAGGGGDDGAVVRVLLGDGVGVSGDHLKFLHGRIFVIGVLLVQVFCLALDVQAAGKYAGFGKTLVNGLLHGLPDVQKERPDLRPFVQLHVVAEGLDVAPFAEIGDLREGMLHVDFFTLGIRLAGDADIAAADGFHPQPVRFRPVFQSDQVHGVGVGGGGERLVGEHDLRGDGGKDLPQHPVGAVTHAGFAQRAVEDHPEAVGLRVGVLKIVRGTFRPHGMGGRGAFAGFVNFTDRFHGGTSKCLVFTPENRRGFLSRLV